MWHVKELIMGIQSNDTGMWYAMMSGFGLAVMYVLPLNYHFKMEMFWYGLVFMIFMIIIIEFLCVPFIFLINNIFNLPKMSIYNLHVNPTLCL